MATIYTNDRSRWLPVSPGAVLACSRCRCIHPDYLYHMLRNNIITIGAPAWIHNWPHRFNVTGIRSAVSLPWYSAHLLDIQHYPTFVEFTRLLSERTGIVWQRNRVTNAVHFNAPHFGFDRDVHVDLQCQAGVEIVPS